MAGTDTDATWASDRTPKPRSTTLLASDDATQTVFPTTTGGPGSGPPGNATLAVSPVAGSIRTRRPSVSANSHFPLEIRLSWANDWRLISSAPHMPPAIRSGAPAGDDDSGEDGVNDAGAEADDAGVPPPGEVTWLWCEVTATAMPALAPATANTRRGRGSRYPPRPCPASLASRDATSSTVTRRGGSGVTWCNISASCRSSVFTTPPLRS